MCQGLATKKRVCLDCKKPIGRITGRCRECFFKKQKLDSNKCILCCKKLNNKDTKKCIDCYNKTRSKQPPKEVLKNLIETKSRSDIRKIYDISFNTLKRWIKLYEL